jgi:predicted DNA-binding transcriptional regulator AlpA
VSTRETPVPSSAVDRVAFTVPEFCFRNSISRPTYHRLRAQGRGPKEMRLGLNAIRITAEAERNWQRSMEKPREDLETRAVERAMKAGELAAKSRKHVSNKRQARR